MADRAVVDEVPCAWCSGDGYVTGSMPCPECTPTPRALVALSEDRQWLVVLMPEFAMFPWVLYRRAYEIDHWVPETHFRDTGQDAHEVLAEWLEGRHEG